MCYKKPGPRCSTHLREQISHLSVAVQEKEERFNALEKQRSEGRMSREDWTEHGQLRRDLVQLRADLHRAQADYNGTADGQTELARQITEARDKGDHIQNHLLTHEFYRARYLRKARKAALAEDEAIREAGGTPGRPTRAIKAGSVPDSLARKLVETRAQANPHYADTIRPLLDEGFELEADRTILDANPNSLAVSLTKESPNGGTIRVYAGGAYQPEENKVFRGGISAWIVLPEKGELALHSGGSNFVGWRSEDYEKAADRCYECQKSVGRANLNRVAFANSACSDCLSAAKQKYERPGWYN